MGENSYGYEDLTNMEADKIYEYLQVKKKIEGYKTWSPSSLKKFLDCRLAYFFQYVKGWRMKSRGTNLALGTAFHAAAELENRKSAMGQPVNQMELLQMYESSWDEETCDFREGRDFKGNEMEKAYTVGSHLVERWWNSHTRKAMRPAMYSPSYSSSFMPAVEMNVDVPLVNIKTGKALRLDHHINGFVDFMAQGLRDTKTFNKDDFMVLDFKTAAKEWDQFTVDTNLQLLMYAYAIRFILRNEDQFPHLKGKDKEDRVGIICLTKKNTVKRGLPPKYGVIKNYIITVEDEEIEYLEQLLLRCILELESNGDDVAQWLPTPTEATCRYCNFKDICLKVRRGADNDDVDAWGEENRRKMERRG